MCNRHRLSWNGREYSPIYRYTVNTSLHSATSHVVPTPLTFLLTLEEISGVMSTEDWELFIKWRKTKTNSKRKTQLNCSLATLYRKVLRQQNIAYTKYATSRIVIDGVAYHTPGLLNTSPRCSESGGEWQPYENHLKCVSNSLQFQWARYTRRRLAAFFSDFQILQFTPRDLKSQFQPLAWRYSTGNSNCRDLHRILWVWAPTLFKETIWITPGSTAIGFDPHDVDFTQAKFLLPLPWQRHMSYEHFR